MEGMNSPIIKPINLFPIITPQDNTPPIPPNNNIEVDNLAEQNSMIEKNDSNLPPPPEEIGKYFDNPLQFNICEDGKCNIDSVAVQYVKVELNEDGSIKPNGKIIRKISDKGVFGYLEDPKNPEDHDNPDNIIIGLFFNGKWNLIGTTKQILKMKTQNKTINAKNDFDISPFFASNKPILIPASYINGFLNAKDWKHKIKMFTTKEENYVIQCELIKYVKFTVTMKTVDSDNIYGGRKTNKNKQKQTKNNKRMRTRKSSRSITNLRHYNSCYSR